MYLPDSLNLYVREYHNQSPCHYPVRHCVILPITWKTSTAPAATAPVLRPCDPCAAIPKLHSGCSLGGGTAQRISSAIYGSVNNMGPLATRFGGRKEKQDKGVASCAAPPVHTVPQCGPGKRLQRLLPEYQHDFKNFVLSVNDVILWGRCLLWWLIANVAYCNNGFRDVKNDLMG